MKLLTPQEFDKVMEAHKAVAKNLFGRAQKKEACADCFACKETEYQGPLLAAQRGANSVVQCQPCFETYTEWAMGELSPTDVAATYATRMANNVKHISK